MCFRLTPFIMLFISLMPLTARADLVTIAIEGEFYSIGDRVTVGAHRQNYEASFVFDTLGEPDLVTPRKDTYINKLVSGRLSVGDLVAVFESDISNFAAVNTQQVGTEFVKTLEIQIGTPPRFPSPPIVQTGGADIGALSRMILLFNSRFTPSNPLLTFDEALAETQAQAWSFTPIVGFRSIPGVGYHEFYSSVTNLTFDRQSLASVGAPGSTVLVVCALVILRRCRAR